MMTTPSIEFTNLAVGLDGLPVQTPTVSVENLPQGADASDAASVSVPAFTPPVPETVRQFQATLARPFAENAVIQRELENIIRQISQTPFVDPTGETPVAPVPVPPTPTGETPVVPVRETSTVDATASRVMEVPHVVPEAPVGSEAVVVTRQAAASTVMEPPRPGTTGILPVDSPEGVSPESGASRPARELSAVTESVVASPVVSSTGETPVVPVWEMPIGDAVSSRVVEVPVDAVSSRVVEVPVDATASRVMEVPVAVMPPAPGTTGILPVDEPSGIVREPMIVARDVPVAPASTGETPVVPVRETPSISERATPIVDATASRVVDVPVDATASRVTEVSAAAVPEVPSAEPEAAVVVTRQAAASTEVESPRPGTTGILPVDSPVVVPPESGASRPTRELPVITESVVASPILSTTGETPVVPVREIPSIPVRDAPADETDLADAVVASGIRPTVEAPMTVTPQAVDVSSPVTAVDSVKAAFAPAEVLPTETFFEVANAVADVLLVTPGLLRGEGEMRVQLRPDVLEGAEIRISVTGRQLGVEFIPPTTDVAVLIEQNRPQLEQHLAARFQTFVLSVGVLRRRTGETRGSVV